MLLSRAITDYISACDTDRHLAPSTLKRYREQLTHFGEWAARQSAADPGAAMTSFAEYAADQARHGQQPVPSLSWQWASLDGLPASLFRDYVASFDAQANKSYNAKLSIMSAFITWCYGEGYLSPTGKHLTGVREKPNTCARSKTYVKLGDLGKVLAAAEGWHVRDRYFLEALWYSRRRSGELCSVRLQDVDLKPYPDHKHGRMVWHNQKAHKPNQVLPLSAPLNACLAEWARVYADLAERELRPSDYLFPAVKPGGITVGGARRRLVVCPGKRIGQPDAIARRAFKEAGVYTLGMANHAVRRGSATDLYEEALRTGHANPLRIVKTSLGHATESMTEAYLDKSKDIADLASVEEQIYGQPAQDAPAGAGQEPGQPAEPATTVVSMAKWKSSKTG